MPHIDTAIWQMPNGLDVVGLRPLVRIFSSKLVAFERRPSRTFALAAFGRKASSFKTSKGQQN